MAIQYNTANYQLLISFASCWSIHIFYIILITVYKDLLNALDDLLSHSYTSKERNVGWSLSCPVVEYTASQMVGMFSLALELETPNLAI